MHLLLGILLIGLFEMMINPGLVISLTFLDDFYIIFFKHTGVICNNLNLMYLRELK